MAIIRKAIMQCLPYGLVTKWYSYRNAQVLHFIDEYFKYKAQKADISPLSEYTSYRAIVAVHGFGYSGSGAVVDLLREFPNVTVLGHIDQEGSKTDEKAYSFSSEQDFVRLSGGLFELEKFIESNNIFHNAAALRRFAEVVEKSSLYQSDNRIRECFFKFFSAITNLHTPVSHPYYNSYLYSWEKPHVISYFADGMNLSQYRTLCKNLISEIAHIVYERFPSDLIVMDQFFNDYEFDINRYKLYAPNIKIICVYRDPRDVLAFAYLNKIEWIPYKNINDYIIWYHALMRKFDKFSKDYLVIRFEDLVCDYNCQLGIVKHFLNIPTNLRQNKFSCFDPQLSRKNIGIWKSCDLPNNYFETIAKELSLFCFSDR